MAYHTDCHCESCKDFRMDMIETEIQELTTLEEVAKVLLFLAEGETTQKHLSSLIHNFQVDEDGAWEFIYNQANEEFDDEE